MIVILSVIDILSKNYCLILLNIGNKISKELTYIKQSYLFLHE